MAPFSGGVRSYKSKFNDFLIAVMILLTKLFRMALRGNLAGAKKQCSYPLVFKNCPFTTPIHSASKAKNACSYIIKNANASLSKRHKEIEFRADHGNSVRPVANFTKSL